MSLTALVSNRHRAHTRSTAASIASRLLLLGALAACGGGGDGTTAPAAVSRIEASVGNVTLNTIGASQIVSVIPRDASGKSVPSATVNWSSDSPNVATVSGNGISATITSVSPGATVIRARVGTIGADIPVQVLGVRTIQVTPGAASIRAGDAQPLGTTFDADPGVPTTVTWTSENTSRATVTNQGVVTGVSPGVVVIRATSVADPRVSGIANITVTPARGVVLDPSFADLATGEQRTLAATVNIETGLSTVVTWRSSAPAVATVNQSGRVTAIAFGTTTISAIAVADTMLRGTATINVVPVVRNITVTPQNATLFIGGSQPMASTVTAEGNLPTTVSWRSSNTTVATVNASGQVTAISIGTTTITALATADTTKKATATISVAARPITIDIVQRVVGLNPGTSSTLTANVGADPGVSTAVGWTSSTPAVASINSGGVVNAVASGVSLITARSLADPTKFDTVTVTVVPRLATNWTAARLNGVLYDDLVSIVAFNPTTAFAVNSINGGASGGDVYRWDGANWIVSASGSTFGTQFQSVHGTEVNTLIAVGNNGVVVHFDGTTWSTKTSGTSQVLRSVWVESGTSAFAVGANGAAIRYNGTTWSTTTTGSTVRLNSVWADGGVAYAVGEGGEVLRYTGGAWTKQNVPFSDDLNGVAGVTGGNVVAVGAFGGILSYNGSSWSLVGNNGILDNLYSVAGSGLNAGRMYIGGDNGLYQLDGSTLTAAGAPYPTTVFSVNMTVGGVVWASGQRGSVERFTGGNWETLNFAPDLLDVWSTSATNAWAVGEYGFVYRWNGTIWTRELSPSLANLYAVWAPSSSDAFAGGDNGTVIRWNGSSWNSMTVPSTGRVFALWGSSASNVFAATDAGEILRFNGTSWTVQATTPGGETLLSVYGVAANQVYATGTDGLVMRYDGTSWTTLTTPNSVTSLYGIWMSGGNNIVSVGADLVGASGFAFNFNGTAWQTMSLASARALTSVWGASVFDLYATGDLGTMLRYNGTGWTPIATGSTDLLWSVSGAPNASGGAFAVGINTTIVSGSSSGAFRSAAMMSSASRRNFEPSAAARRDRKASGKAAAGAARRNRAVLAGRSAVMRNTAPRRR